MRRGAARRAWTALLLAGGLAAAVLPARSAAPRFYPDDPIWHDDDTVLDASGVGEREDKGGWDFLNHTFFNPGERRSVRALNVNTLDEVPDSSWFTNRIGRHPMTIAAIVRGPDGRQIPSLDGWIVSGGKSTGVQPGFRMTDPSGHLYQIEIDPDTSPELATGAEIIGTAFYHAFGYHVVEVYLAELDRAALVISPKATIKDPLNGRRRPLRRRDVDAVLRRARRLPNGRYRVLVSRFADGRPAGNFRYYGTRPDDPNDIVPHEHRRELRGARVFGAWLNHDDSRGVNSLDFVVGPEGRRSVKHYMFDFGSILGSGTIRPQAHRAGNEYIFEWVPGWLTLATLGFYTRPWMHIDYPDVPPSVGRIEADVFEPRLWRPEYPNPAFQNMRPDDAFWAARIVARFSPEAVRAVVGKARYSDPRAADYLTEVLLKRQQKVLRTWLNQVNPVVDLALDRSGRLTFTNAAVDAGVATPADSYTLRWFRLDNATDSRTDAGEPETVTGLAARAPADVLSGGDHIGVVITALHPREPLWATPATFFFRRQGAEWAWIGAER